MDVSQVFWVASRGAGIGAIVLASASVGLGLAQRIPAVRARVRELRPVHEALALATLAAIVLHGVLLLGDGWLKPTLAQLTVPFAASFSPFWTALGILSFYALALMSLSYYARGHIGVARWRALHRFTIVPWAGGLIHALGMGSDAGTTWFLALVGLTAVPALVLLALRSPRAGPAPHSA
jgi:methionine sulfoxide reductase heme-binding subunit